MSVIMRDLGTIALALALALPPMPAFAGEGAADDPAAEAVAVQGGIDDEELAPVPEGAVDEATPSEDADGGAEEPPMDKGEDDATGADDVEPEAETKAEVEQVDAVPLEGAPAPARAAAAGDVSACTLVLGIDGSATYTGSAITPAVRVVAEDADGNVAELAEGTDYTLSYKDNTAVGTATVTVTGTGEWGGTATLRFQIVAADLSGATVSAIPTQIYTGSALTPKPTVRLGDHILAEGTDYTLSYKNNTAVGTATVTVTGTGNYKGTATAAFAIAEAGTSLSGASVTGLGRQTYAGKALTPKPTVKLNGRTLKVGTDYTLSYKDNTKAGTATVTVKGMGGYTGSVAATFEIARADVAEASVGGLVRQTYTGSALKPKPTVKLNGRTLKVGTDYTLSYKDNTKAGTATVTVKGRGNYAGSLRRTFRIVSRKSLKGRVDVVVWAAYWREGRAVRPKVTVRLRNRVLKEGTDYTVSYRRNKRIGTARVTVRGKGLYKGRVTQSFEIERCPLSQVSVGGTATTRVHYATGSALTPSVRVTHDGRTLRRGRDYTLSYKNNTKAGFATVTIRGKGKYRGTTTRRFQIMTRNLSNEVLTKVSVAGQTYTGSALTPSVRVTHDGDSLKAGRDYTMSYSNNTKAGTATVTVRGKGAVKGTATATFSIARADVSKASVTGLATQKYTSKALTPRPTVKLGGKLLKEGTDYTVSYASNVAKGKGTARVTVTGIGNYRGVKTASFSIGAWVEDGRTWVVDKAAGEYKYRNTTSGHLYLAQPIYNNGVPTCSRSFEKVFTSKDDLYAYVDEMRDEHGASLSWTWFLPGQQYWIWEDEAGHWETTGHWEY